MSLKFGNSFTQDVWLFYVFHSPDDCGGEGRDWQGIGWFHAAVGETVTVYSNDLDDVHNRYWYFYAESGDGQSFWAGEPAFFAGDDAFNHCIGEGRSDWRQYGLRIIDVGDNDDYTVTLTP
jgi:uncharacterized membrane protein